MSDIDSDLNSELDIDELLLMLETKENEYLSKLDNSKVKQIKNDIFQKLHFNPTYIKKLHKKLQNYMFVDDVENIQYGRYIRWINIVDPNNLKLTNGGIICDIKVVKDGINITCKNNFNRLFTLKLDENLIFQKITNQEHILLSVMDIINK